MSNKIVFFCICVIFNGTSAKNAIIGGKKAELGDFPYQVILYIHGQNRMCGGGIIGEHHQHILTAAHCVVKSNNEIDDGRITIVAGINDRRSARPPPVVAQVKKIYVPKNFVINLKILVNDIAVIKLRRPLDGSQNPHLKALELPKDNHQSYKDKKAKIAGFGWDYIKIHDKHEVGGYTDSQMRYAITDVLSPGQHGFPNQRVPFKLIWARVEQHTNEHRGVCAGDSGGPLVYEEKIVIGVLSSGPHNCSEADVASSYTDVSQYLKFIDHALHDEHDDNIRTLEH